MVRAVLDANTLVAGIPTSAGTLAAIIDRWRAGEFQVVVSEHILDEVRRAWIKPYWRVRFSQSRVDQALALLRQDAEVAELTLTIEGVATHPEDDLVLATALSAQVDYLATGNKDLQALGTYQGIVILSPRDFLTFLEQHRHVEQEHVTGEEGDDEGGKD